MAFSIDPKPESKEFLTGLIPRETAGYTGFYFMSTLDLVKTNLSRRRPLMRTSHAADLAKADHVLIGSRRL
jgi:hypothetical protein